LGGIKRRGKAIKRARNIPHHQALDESAREAGYNNFKHAQAALARADNQHTAYLTCYWAKRGGPFTERGCETLAVPLALPLKHVVSRHQLDHARHLAGFRLVSTDHVERKTDLDSQDSARSELRHAARTLQFMAATGLRPATTLRERRPILNKFETLPGADHYSLWLSVPERHWVYMDEPYEKPELGERLTWVQQRGMHMVRPSWDGLYSPGRTPPFLFCLDEDFAAWLSAKLSALPRADNENGWKWISDRYSSQFSSQKRIASGKPRRARPMPAPYGVERKGALPYGRPIGGANSLWRPARRMPLELHLTIGPLFRALAASGLDYRVAMLLGKARALLDDWLQMEYSGNEMSTNQFQAPYYGKSTPPLDSPELQLAAVRSIREALAKGYQQCRPRDELIQRLASVEAAIAQAT
jgi:hypothetical protein